MMRISFRAHGDVQGLGYRRFVAHEAHALDLSGWVRNEMDGSVAGEVEGPRATLEVFRTRLAGGHAHATVGRLDWEDLDVRSSLPHPFEIHR